MVAAAAIAANKKRQAKAKAKRDALRKQLENDKKEAEGFFNDISTDDGKTIPSDKLADLLQRAIGNDHTVNDDGKAMVLNHLGKKQGSEPPHENLQLPKDDVVEAIGKYRYFLTHADKIERLFAEFDKNHNNILEKAELKKAMQAIEDREHSGSNARLVFGMETRVRVTDEDVDYIMELCDESGDGGIDRAEALPALARWDSLANIHVEQQKSCACAVS